MYILDMQKYKFVNHELKMAANAQGIKAVII